MEPAEILTNIGFVIAGILGGLIAYYGKKPPASPPVTDAVVAGVGIELGNRHQTDQLIEQLTRIGDILENKKQQGLEEMLLEIREKMDTRAPAPRRRRKKPSLP